LYIRKAYTGEMSYQTVQKAAAAFASMGVGRWANRVDDRGSFDDVGFICFYVGPVHPVGRLLLERRPAIASM
jgi:hypothetical protein